MSLRWLWFDHIPPELNVPKEARRTIRRRARKQKLRMSFAERIDERRYVLVGQLAILGFAIWLIFFKPFGLPMSIMIALVLNLLIAAIGLWFVVQPWSAPVRRCLCQLGYYCCVKCGHVHTGLSKDVKECPECGRAREFGKCIHCKSPQDWPMQPDDKCTQCGRLRLS